MILLSIDTSTEVCSAAISENGRCLRQEIDGQGQNHAKLLSRFIEMLLGDLRQAGKKIDAVALSQGPGSYTGLRIGTATAKGLCYGLDVPLVAVDTLQVMAASALSQMPTDDPAALLCPMIDARRMEVYDALYDRQLRQKRAVQADVVEADYFAEDLQMADIYFFGNGSDKCRNVLTASRAHFLADVVPEARFVAPLAETLLAAGKKEDIAYFEPFYLKEFQATVSRHKLW